MATKTLGLSGRDYSTLAAWAAYANALSLSANEILEVYNDGGPVADTTSITIGGWTANGFSVTIRPASGQGIRHNANKLTNAYRYNTANGAALTNSIGYADAYILNGANLIIEDLQFRASATAASSVMRGGAGAVISRCILYRPAGGVVYGQAANITLRDSLLLHGAGGNGLAVSGDNVDIDNCTLANLSGGGAGIQQTYTQSVPPRVRNTAFRGFTTAAQGTYRSGSTNNATTTASWTGTGISGTTSIADTEWESVTSSSEDFRLRSTASATMKTGGSTGVGSGSDGVATTRGVSNYSIGAWEAASAGAALTGSITFDNVDASGSILSLPTALTGTITLADIAPSGTLGLVPGTVTTNPFTRNTGSRPLGLTAVAVAILSDDANMTKLAGATSLSQDGSGRISYTGAGLPSTGTSVLVVTRESDGTLGLERYTVQ